MGQGKYLSKEISGSDVPGRGIRQSSTSSQFCSATLPLLSTDPAQYKAAQSRYLSLFSPLLFGRTGEHVKWPELGVRMCLPLQSVQSLLSKNNGVNF